MIVQQKHVCRFASAHNLVQHEARVAPFERIQPADSYKIADFQINVKSDQANAFIKRIVILSPIIVLMRCSDKTEPNIPIMISWHNGESLGRTASRRSAYKTAAPDNFFCSGIRTRRIDNRG
jgi:hypothetical protein